MSRVLTFFKRILRKELYSSKGKEYRVKRLAKTLLALYLLFLLWLVLFKFSLHFSTVLDSGLRGINLVPFASKAHTGQLNLIGMVLNLLFFIPFGLLLSVLLKQVSFWRKLLYIFMFSVAVELIQFVFAIGITDITDVIMNAGGGLLGLALYSLGQNYTDSKKLGRWTVATVGTVLILVFVAVLSLQLLHDALKGTQ
jgi:glycopeptide antibiotics resistance protein